MSLSSCFTFCFTKTQSAAATGDEASSKTQPQGKASFSGPSNQFPLLSRRTSPSGTNRPPQSSPPMNYAPPPITEPSYPPLELPKQPWIASIQSGTKHPPSAEKRAIVNIKKDMLTDNLSSIWLPPKGKKVVAKKLSENSVELKWVEKHTIPEGYTEEAVNKAYAALKENAHNIIRGK